MKKILTFAALAFALALPATAQYTDQNGNEHETDHFQAEYQFIEDGWGVGIGISGKYVFVSADYEHASLDEFEYKIDKMKVALGLKYRYYAYKGLYAEGRLGIGYYHSEFEYPGTPYWHETNIFGQSGGFWVTPTETEKDNSAYLLISPRIGYDFGKVSIEAAYRWDALKFKFKKGTYDKFFSIGAAINF